jgi:hypothetical protein
MNAHSDLVRLAESIAIQPDAIAAAAAQGTLADWLYHHWYLTPDPRLAERGAVPPWDELEASLCDIVDAQSPWRDDWVVLSIDANGGCLAGRGEARRWVTSGRYAGCERPGLPPVPGDRISMPDHLSWSDPETGQWAAQSASPPDGDLIRLYVNIGSDAIGHAVRRIVAWLVDGNIPFRMKCPGSKGGFERADALVLYLGRADWPANRPAVLAWAKEIEPLIRPGRPALTLPLAPGIAFAEDPGGGRSFGQDRCAVLAEAITKLPERSEDIAAELEQAIEAAGILVNEPWRYRS